MIAGLIHKFFISTLIFGYLAATGIPVGQGERLSMQCCTLRYRQLRAMTITADV